METKYLIIMGILILVICVLAGALYLVMTGSEGYERIEISSNGTSIEVPANQLNYLGDTDGVKYWNWDDGALVTYNSQEGNNALELDGALGFYAIKELVQKGNSENIDGFTVYKLDANEISNSVKTNVKGDFYCIHLSNETTHDNIVICCKDKDVALHMAKSVQYKSANTDNNANNTNDSKNVNDKSGLIPVTYDDGSVAYFHAGEIISLPNGYYRVNSDGSLTKVADDSYSPDTRHDNSENNVEITTQSSSDSSSNEPQGIDRYGTGYDDIETSTG